jgi:hypothetical protein
VKFRDKMPKNSTKFNPAMQAEFPLLKPVSDSESKVLCAFCNAKIDIAFGGRLCITRHVETRTPDWEKNVVPAAEFVLKHQDG